jgi:hypothetical protein
MNARATLAGWTLLVAIGCERAPRHGAVDARVTTWGEDEEDAHGQRSTSDGESDGDASELAYQGPPVLQINGRPAGFIRFVHIAPGAGRVRFVGMSIEGYERASVSAEVDEGTSSGYLPTVNVPHRVRVLPAGVDADAGAGAELAASIVSDVYNNAGCTVVFGGRARWTPRARAQDPEVRRLVRVIDIPRRDARTLGMLRFMAGIADAWPLTILEDGSPVYERLPFLVITGMRRMPPGAHAFTLQNRDGTPVTTEPLRVELPGGEAHTLWLYADRPRAGVSAVRYVLTNDVPAGRIGPDFTGEMPVYR